MKFRLNGSANFIAQEICYREDCKASYEQISGHQMKAGCY